MSTTAPELQAADALAARRRLATTLDELEMRLNPANLANEAVDAVAERGSMAVAHIRDTIRDYQTGFAIIAGALGIIAGARMISHHRKEPAMSTDDDFDASHTDQPGTVKRKLAEWKEGAAHARDTLRERAGEARDFTSEKLHAARERAGEYADVAREKARAAGRQTRDSVDHNPLAAALAGFAVGAIVGALLPRTRREDEVFGPTRDRVADKARDAARAARDAGAARLEELGLKEHAREELGRLRDSATEIARSAREAATEQARGKPSTMQ
jgi:ElaB/YqjD/DUF883 family membrane-anchored ribosome-binding protein